MLCSQTRKYSIYTWYSIQWALTHRVRTHTVADIVEQSCRVCRSHIRLHHFLAREHRPECWQRSTYVRMWALVCTEHAHRPIGCRYFRPYFSDCPIIVSAPLDGFHSVLVRCWVVLFSVVRLLRSISFSYKAAVDRRQPQKAKKKKLERTHERKKMLE